MKKILFAILLSAVFSFATEMCNPGATTNIPVGWCYSDGYVCYVTTEATGGIRFSLGKDSKCSLANLEKTKFYTFEQNAQGGLNTNDTLWTLRPYLAESAIDNVSALAVAINTAFIINAFNEKIKVRIQYHFVGNSHDINSIRLLGIGKAL
ncbi:MAG: hypothetical protein IJM92_08250 [Fibrobacter sp.]|uniref:hypothetical protein n=1 Tax=Fibrobacter sp. TaxID=35828 RepID=UPI0025C6D6F8|nr:hypothetical protein [Fibrobacter sp.]MBQ7079642.1 hypothetical protein [Fibrobacter sp.]